MTKKTREDYKAAVKKAVAMQEAALQAGRVEEAREHLEVAELIAAEAVTLFGAYKAPLDPNREPLDYMGLREYSKGVSERYEDFDPMKTLSEFPDKFVERRQTLGERPSVLTSAAATAGVGLSQAARTGGELLGEGISVLLPDFVREGAETAWKSIKDKPGIKQGLQAATDSLETYQGWAKENPEFAEAIETTVDVVAMTASAAKIDVSGEAKRSKDSFDNAVVEERMAGVNELLKPEYVGEEGFGDNQWVATGGILNKSVYIPNQRELKIQEAVESIKELDVNSHFVKAAQVINEAVEAKSAELIAFIKRAGNPKYNKQEYAEELRAEFKNLKNSKIWGELTTEAQNKANYYLKIALSKLKESNGDSLGLLQLRRDFDDYVKFGSKADPLSETVESAKGAAGKIVRNLLNSKLERITPEGEVRERLNRLHNLMLGRDRLNQRKFKEGGNRIIRTWNKLKDDLSLPTTPLALLATYSAVGTVGASVGVGAGVATYAAIQALKKTSRLKFYATMVSGLDKTIKKYKSDKNLVAELKADRAYIVYLMNETRQEKETDGK